MAKMRKKQISRKQRKQRKHNLTGLNFESLMDLRNQVDEALSGYRSTLERQLEALGSSVASLGGKVARRMRGSMLKGTKVAPSFVAPRGKHGRDAELSPDGLWLRSKREKNSKILRLRRQLARQKKQGRRSERMTATRVS